MSQQAKYENRFHTTSEVPYSYYKCYVPNISICIPLHWHREFEINYIISGRASFRVNNTTYLSEKGDIMIVQPNALHSIYPYQNDSQVYETLVFDSDILEIDQLSRSTREYIEPIKNNEMLLIPRITAADKGYAKIHRCVKDIFQYVNANNARDDIMIKSKLLELIYLMLEGGYAETADTYNVLSILKPALVYISDHFRDEIKIQELADTIHVSESYFMSLFHKHIGLSAMEYINQIRIKEACHLLRTTNHSVMEVALISGFRNISNFNRHFKRMTGVSPVEYRKI